jgi:hypothetical protein
MIVSTVREINVYYDEDGMFGAGGPDGYDVEASYHLFEEMVTEKIKADYQDVKVNVTYKQANKCCDVWPEYADNAEEVIDSVEYEVQKIHSSFEWALYFTSEN